MIYNMSTAFVYEEYCARGKYQEQGKVITPQSIYGM